jgi:hypothetical protein
MVRLSPYLAHFPLVILSDYYFYKLGKRLIGDKAARFAFIFYFTNAFFNQYIIRCFSNSVETILHLIIFWHFLEIKNRFDKHLAIIAFLISVAFVIRNTAPIGWIPLVIYKIIKDRSLINFIIAFILVVIPTLSVLILIDSVYYGELTITAWNFVKINVLENRSAEFGISSPCEFVLDHIPKSLNYLTDIVYIGLIYYMFLCIKKRQFPLIIVFMSFYLVVISNIPHKEDRFMLPVMPYLFIMAGLVMSKKIMNEWWLLLPLTFVICV